MDKIPQAIYISKVDRNVNEKDVKRVITNLIGNGVEYYRDEGLVVKEVSPKTATSRFFIVSGILLPFGKIVQKLAPGRLGRFQIHIHDVDYGLERGIDGRLSSQQMLLHEKLKIASGFGTSFNFLNWEFRRNQLGGLEILEPYLFLKTEKHPDQIGLWRFKTPFFGLLRWMPTMSNKMKLESRQNNKIKNDLIWLFFSSSLHALQFLLRYNRSEELAGVNSPFIVHWIKGVDMTDPEFREPECQLTQNRGLGLAQTHLNIDRLVEGRGMIPFSVIDPDIMNHEKVSRLIRVPCFYCYETLELEGISSHCTPVFGKCQCRLRGTNTRITTKMAIKKSVEQMTLKYQRFHFDTEDAMFPVIPGVQVLFENLQEMADSIGQCLDYEILHKNRVFFLHQAAGTVIQSHVIANLSKPLSPYYDLRIIVQVPVTDIWSFDGSLGFGSMTVVFNPAFDDHGLVERNTNLSEVRVKGRLYDVYGENGRCNVVLRVKVPFSLEIVKGGMVPVVLIPIASKTRRASFHSALTHRRMYEEQEKGEMLFEQVEILGLARDLGLVLDRNEGVSETYSFCFKICPKTSAWLSRIIPHSYVGFNANITNMQDLGDGQMISKWDTNGRVTGVDTDRLYGIMLLPVNVDTDDARMSVSFWVMHPQPLAELFRLARQKESNLEKAEQSEGNEDFGEFMTRLPKISSEGERANGDEHSLHDDYEDERDGATQTKKINYFKWSKNNVDLTDFLNVNDIGVMLKCWEERPLIEASAMNLFFQPRNKFPFPVQPIKQVVKNQKKLLEYLDVLLKDFTPEQRKSLENGQRYFLSVVEGYPGVGKTDALIMAVIYQALCFHGLVVVTAPTNEACDVIMERLREKILELGLENIFKILRMWSKRRGDYHHRDGNEDKNKPDDMHEAVRRHPLWRSDHQVNLIIDKLEKHGPGTLLDEEQKMYERHYAMIESLIIPTINVLVATCDAACDERLASLQLGKGERGLKISTIFVDEASKAGVAMCFSLMKLCSSHFTLYGDPNQLSKVPSCAASDSAGFNISWLQLLSSHPLVKSNSLITRFTRQYRMADQICSIVSEFGYDNALHSDISVLERDYSENGMFSQLFTEFPEMTNHNVLLYDYLDRDMEVTSLGEFGFANYKEVEIVCGLLERLNRTGWDMKGVAVLSFYKKQCIAMREAIGQLGEDYDHVTNTTVDSVQGRQIGICILSLVRSNFLNNVGFFRDQNHLTVGLSRAIDYLIVVCDNFVFSDCGIPGIEGLLRNLKDPAKAFRKTITL